MTAGPIHENPSDDINPEWLKEGVLAVPLDYDSYWNTRAINSFDKFFVDDVSQVMHYKNQDIFFRNIPEIDSHLADIVIGKDPGRTSNSQKIMCMNLGIATEDMAIAIEIFNRAVEKGIGTWIRR